MTGSSANDGNYSSATFDELLHQAAAASSVEESKKIYVKAQSILMKDLPAIPLWYPNGSTAWNPSSKTSTLCGTGTNYTLIENPYPKSERTEPWVGT